jgi:hypothetical protein
LVKFWIVKHLTSSHTKNKLVFVNPDDANVVNGLQIS